jgi:hypothetical protein
MNIMIEKSKSKHLNSNMHLDLNKMGNSNMHSAFICKQKGMGTNYNNITLRHHSF